MDWLKLKIFTFQWESIIQKFETLDVSFSFQIDDSSGDKIGGWFIRAKSVDDLIDEESCPKEGCYSDSVLKNVPRLGSKDTVIVLLHGNAKVKSKLQKLD